MRKWLLLLAALVLAAPAYAGDAADSLLPADQAFHLTTQVVNPDTLEAHWDIADGYYMYRDKFKFQSLDNQVALQAPVFPAGKMKSDPSFGKVEIYTHSVTVLLPIVRQGAGATTAQIQITGQGCNEPVGVCYPPITKTVSFDLPAAAATAAMTPTTASGPLAALRRALTGAGGNQQFLPVDQAFGLSVGATGKDALLAQLHIAPGYYLYRDRISFAVAGPQGMTPLRYTLPPGDLKNDPTFGPTQVYHQDIAVPLTGKGLSQPNAELVAKYQGCAEQGICYPPVTKHIALASLAPVGTAPAAGAPAQAPVTAAASPATVTPRTITLKDLVLAVVAAFGTGLLLTFTPCVLPMIPILSSVIVGQGGKRMTRLRTVALSASYVLGTSVTYTSAGVLAGLTGLQLQAYFQNPWAIGGLSTLFVLLALSMFGFYELQVPAFIQSHLHHRTRHVQGGSLVGTFLLGLVSALIVGACVSPLLISALSVAIASHSPTLGGAIMFAMSLGMGVILVLVGVGAGTLLPRAGAWMDRVKHIFGVLLLGVAIYLLGLLPQVPVLFLWAALLVITGVYLGATQSLPAGAGGWRYFAKGIGTFMLIWGTLALVGGFAGNRDILQPLPLARLSGATGGTGPAGPTQTATAAEPLFQRVATVSELNHQLAAAQAAGKPVVLDYYATWCTDCVRLERTTFADPAVRQAMQRFVRLQADVTDQYAPATQALKRQFNVFGPPAILLFAPGSVAPVKMVYGYHTPQDMIALLGQL